METLHLPLLIFSFSFHLLVSTSTSTQLHTEAIGAFAPHRYEPPSAAAPAPPKNVTLVLVAGMIVCVAIFFLTYLIAYKTIFVTRGEWNPNYFTYRERSRDMGAAEHQYRSEDEEGGGGGGAAVAAAGAREGLEASLLSSFPITYYSSAMASTCTTVAHIVLMKECAVCLSEFEEGEEMKLLPVCGHCFHKACIDRWLFSHTTCPICRLSLLINHTEEDKQAADQAPLEQPSAIAAN